MRGTKQLEIGLIIGLLSLQLAYISAQDVGINTNSPDPSAILDMVSQNKGFLVPRMTGAERSMIASPSNALLVYQTDGNSGFYFYDNATLSWKLASGVGHKIQDADGNTMVQTEESANENIIRFDIAGTEKINLRKNIASSVSSLNFVNNQGNVSFGDSTVINYSNSAFSNIAFGNAALNANIGGDENVAIGAYALSDFNESNGIAIGSEALRHTVLGDYYNIGIGNRANFHGGGDANVIIGAGAAPETSFFSNLVVGQNANFSNGGNGSRNILIGKEAMYNSTTASSNIGIGYRVLYGNSAYSLNANIGSESGNRGTLNLGVGFKSLSMNNGDENVAIGSSSLLSHNTGSYNQAIGYNAMANHVLGEYNIALGANALYNGTNSQSNISVGSKSLYQNAGSYNVGIGFNAQNMMGDASSYNVIIGANSQNNAIPGDNNIAIGQNAEVAAGVSNSIALGKDAYASLSNTVILGSVAGVNGATETAQVGLGTSHPHSSAIFEAKSSTKAFHLPGGVAPINPAEGLLKVGDESLIFYDGTEWKDIMDLDLYNQDGAMNGEAFVSRNGNMVKGYPNTILSKDTKTSKATIENTINDNKFKLFMNDEDALLIKLNANGQLIMETPNANKNILTGAYDTAGDTENTILSTENYLYYPAGNTFAGNLVFHSSGNNRIGLGENVFFSSNGSANNESIGIGANAGIGMSGDRLIALGQNTIQYGQQFIENDVLLGEGSAVHGDADRATCIGKQAEIKCDDCVILGREVSSTTDNETEVGIGSSEPTSALFIAGDGGSSNPQLLLERTLDEIVILDFKNLLNTTNCDISANPSNNINNSEFILGDNLGGTMLILKGNGDMTLTSLAQTSDSSLKENIIPLKGVLPKLDNIRPVSYHWIDDSKDEKQFGVLAQDVAKEFPELVEKNDEGFLSVNYAGINSLLWQSLKELNDKSLENEMVFKQQQLKIIELKKRIELLKLKSVPNTQIAKN